MDNRCMNWWVGGQMLDRWMCSRMDKMVDDTCVEGWVDAWMDECVKRWMNGWFMHEWMGGWMAMVLGTRSALSAFTVGTCCYKGRADFPQKMLEWHLMTIQVALALQNQCGGGQLILVHIHGVEAFLCSSFHCNNVTTEWTFWAVVGGVTSVAMQVHLCSKVSGKAFSRAPLILLESCCDSGSKETALELGLPSSLESVSSPEHKGKGFFPPHLLFF